MSLHDVDLHMPSERSKGVGGRWRAQKRRVVDGNLTLSYCSWDRITDPPVSGRVLDRSGVWLPVPDRPHNILSKCLSI